MTDWTPQTFTDKNIIPGLLAIDSYSKDAEVLILATAMTESNLKTVYQVGGPALGYWQMEPETNNDIFSNFLGRTNNQHLMDGLHKLSSRVGYPDELAKNPQYAAAMARIFYLRCPSTLPDAGDMNGIWLYYKEFWNTKYGAATRDHFFAAIKGLLA